MLNIAFTPDAVKERLSNLNPNKSCGPDSIHPRVLKELTNELIVPITIILNSCFETGSIPSVGSRQTLHVFLKRETRVDLVIIDQLA